MLQLIINGIVADLPSDPKVAITYEANNIGNLADRNGSFANTFDLPLTGNNRNIFGLSDQIGSAFDTGATLPVQAFYTNWLIFEGVCRVVRYFGNNLQVELIGGVGTLVEAIGVKTLGDFEYPDFEVLQATAASYGPKMNTTADLVKVGKVDVGVWKTSQNATTAGVPQFYALMLPIWYDLRATIRQVCSGLGYELAGSILTDSLMDDVYLQQGYWGGNRELEQYNGLTANLEINFPIFRVFSDKMDYLAVTSTTIPWVALGAVGGGLVYDPALGGIPGKYKFTINWTGHSLFSGPSTYSVTYKVMVNIGSPSSGGRSFTFGNAETELTFTNTLTGAGSFDVEVDCFLTDITFSAYEIQLLFVRDASGAGVVLDILGITGVMTFELLDVHMPQQFRRAKDCLPRVTVADFFLDICQRFGYTIDANTTTNKITFNSQSNLDNRTLAVDWNGKVESPLDSQFGTQYQTEFVYGSYAKSNRYLDASGNLHYIGILEANVDTPLERDAYTSIGSEVTVGPVIRLNRIISGQTITNSFGGEGNDGLTPNIVGTPYDSGDVIIQEGQSMALNTSTTVFGIIYGEIEDATLNPDSRSPLSPNEIFSWENDTVAYGKLGAAQGNLFILGESNTPTLITNPCLFTPYIGGWQTALDTRYQWLSAILSNPRIHKVLVRIRPTDLPLSFDKPIYWNQAYWYLVSVQDFNPMTGENTVCVLAQIPDYPTR